MSEQYKKTEQKGSEAARWGINVPSSAGTVYNDKNRGILVSEADGSPPASAGRRRRHMILCLYNTHSDNVAAFCKKHRCGMTVKQIRCRECLSKQCWYLVKYQDHPWWKQREIIKRKRIERKKMYGIC